MGWTGAISAKVRATKSHQNFSQGMHPIHPVSPKLMFGCILDSFVTARSSIKNELVQLMQKLLHEVTARSYCTKFNAKVRSNEVTSEFFATNAPDPPHWTLNACFVASHSIWVHLAMFRYYTKLGAKRVELVQLMQKFVPWSHMRIFCNECTQSTPLDPKLMFWCVS